MWRQIVRPIPHRIVRSIPHRVVPQISQRIVRSIPQTEHMDYLMYWELTTPEIIYINDEISHIDHRYSGNNFHHLDAYRFMLSEQPHSDSIDQWIRRNYLLHMP